MSLADAIETLQLCGDMELDFVHVSAAGTSGQRVNLKERTCLTQHGFENIFQPMFRSSPPVAFGHRMKHARL